MPAQPLWPVPQLPCAGPMPVLQVKCLGRGLPGLVAQGLALGVWGALLREWAVPGAAEQPVRRLAWIQQPKPGHRSVRAAGWRGARCPAQQVTMPPGWPARYPPSVAKPGPQCRPAAGRPRMRPRPAACASIHGLERGQGCQQKRRPRPRRLSDSGHVRRRPASMHQECRTWVCHRLGFARRGSSTPVARLSSMRVAGPATPSVSRPLAS